ncbi:MAG: rRNA maturation RNase YbeY [Candidatus Binataceae bacterium]|nr:rRNA maturation RNase YbeY [Candidatus Binataceae bacterium]
MLDLGRCELSIAIVGDRAIRRLNLGYRGKDQATDVLSFPQLEARAAARLQGHGRAVARPEAKNGTARGNDGPPIALGDIAISIDTAVRQARILGEPIAARVRTLLIHGMLHLLGYDHERSPAAARRMFARERELAARLAAARGATGAQVLTDVGAAANDRGWPPAAMPPDEPDRIGRPVAARDAAKNPTRRRRRSS